MRALKADEIEVRVGQVYEKGVSMLLYKNARVDMAMLDEEFGTFGWQRDHKEIKGNLYCGIGVYDQAKECWVWKWDCGTESNTEKEKGEASDSFKRAGVCWGIGRELYTAPFIFMPCATDPIPQGNYTRYKMHNPYEFRGVYVSHIKTEEAPKGKLVITALELSQRDKQGNSHKIYEWGGKG